MDAVIFLLLLVFLALVFNIISAIGCCWLMKQWFYSTRKSYGWNMISVLAIFEFMFHLFILLNIVGISFPNLLNLSRWYCCVWGATIAYFNYKLMGEYSQVPFKFSLVSAIIFILLSAVSTMK